MALSFPHLQWKDNMQLTQALKHHTKTNLFQGKYLTQIISVWFNNRKNKKSQSLKMFFSHIHKDTNKTTMSSDRHGGKIKDEEGRKR